MKFGNVVKSTGENSEVTVSQLAKINLLTRKELKTEDVYVFPVIACDNELDRTNDKFKVSCLNELVPLYIGKTMICDHERKNSNQIARIFDAEVISIPSVVTKDGETLHQLKVWAYMLKNAETQPIIDNIEAGIYKEVSVNCKVASMKCNICQQEYFGGECYHFKGRDYDGKICYTYLDKATDAYELSFVAVPAQPGAGVTKWYDGDETAKKGKGESMNYEETKKSLTALGIDLDGIAKTKGEVPEMSVIFSEIQKRFNEATSNVTLTVFTTAEAVSKAMGKDTVTEAEMITALKSVTDNEIKAKLYDGIKAKAIEDAVKSGVKAKGEAFNEERYKKMFESFSIDEINAQAADWNDEAKKTLNAGNRFSEQQSEKDASLLKSYTKPNLNF